MLEKVKKALDLLYKVEAVVDKIYENAISLDGGSWMVIVEDDSTILLSFYIKCSPSLSATITKKIIANNDYFDNIHIGESYDIIEQNNGTYYLIWESEKVLDDMATNDTLQ